MEEEDNYPDKIYHYFGSLTIPPCTENLRWVVLNHPLSISPTQVAAFNNKWKNNGNFAGGKGNNRAT